MIHEVGIFFQGQASIANAQSIGITSTYTYLHTCRYQICCKIHDLYSDLLYRMVNAYDSRRFPPRLDRIYKPLPSDCTWSNGVNLRGGPLHILETTDDTIH